MFHTFISKGLEERSPRIAEKLNCQPDSLSHHWNFCDIEFSGGDALVDMTHRVNVDKNRCHGWNTESQAFRERARFSFLFQYLLNI